MKRDDVEQKLVFYYENKTIIHISCSSGRFYNGKILFFNNEKGFLALKDLKLGEVPIWFHEILTIEPYTKKGENEDGK